VQCDKRASSKEVGKSEFTNANNKFGYGKYVKIIINFTFHCDVNAIPFLKEMGIHSVHQQILPPSGVEFASSLNLTPSTLESNSNVVLRHEFVSRVICNLVVARSSLLRIFEVREEPAPVVQDEEKDRTLTVRRGTEAVEGEVEMDEQGDGYINIAKVIASSSYALLRVFKNSQPAGC